MFRRNSTTDGFSFTLPRCLCCPKKFSRGSWQSRFDKNTLTPGTAVNRYSTSSTNDITGKIEIIYTGCVLCAKQYTYVTRHSPVILRPSRVSLLRSIIAFSDWVNPSLSCTPSSHSSRYGRNTSFNHYSVSSCRCNINIAHFRCMYRFQSVAERKGDLKGFCVLFPADKLLQFIQSKNLSNISANRAVSFALSPTTSVRAFATELLKTCYTIDQND